MTDKLPQLYCAEPTPVPDKSQLVHAVPRAIVIGYSGLAGSPGACINLFGGQWHLHHVPRRRRTGVVTIVVLRFYIGVDFGFGESVIRHVDINEGAGMARRRCDMRFLGRTWGLFPRVPILHLRLACAVIPTSRSAGNILLGRWWRGAVRSRCVAFGHSRGCRWSANRCSVSRLP